MLDSGWNLRCMDSGNMHHFVGADSSCISWGHAQHGELGYGPNAQKYVFDFLLVFCWISFFFIKIFSGFTCVQVLSSTQKGRSSWGHACDGVGIMSLLIPSFLSAFCFMEIQKHLTWRVAAKLDLSFLLVCCRSQNTWNASGGKLCWGCQ